jgi:hypothetical protein
MDKEYITICVKMPGPLCSSRIRERNSPTARNRQTLRYRL